MNDKFLVLKIDIEKVPHLGRDLSYNRINYTVTKIIIILIFDTEMNLFAFKTYLLHFDEGTV